MANAKQLYERRRRRTRYRLRRLAGGRPRLSVFRSNKHIYAQVIDDGKGVTVAAASSVDTELKGTVGNSGATEAAEKVGALVAKRALAAGVSNVVFDRGGYRYHGRVKALADAAREAGLTF
jgi:large subunit ribosomal protein L18